MGACTAADFCPFVEVSMVFPGTAHSVDFIGAANFFFSTTSLWA
ncbi:MAG TPA: hypothetical protein VGF34_04500 [Stellaceae bacterium]|jgi:hypothetical protein